MGGLALVFPGQGAQALGMGLSLARCSAAAASTLAEADRVLGFSLTRLLADGPVEALTLTANAQPAILTVSVMAHRALAERVALSPVAAAGHSLGEFSALVAAGTLSFVEALRLVRLRGELMQAAVPVGRGGMAAVVGLDQAAITAVLREIDSPEAPVGISGFNSPEQITISGEAAALGRAVDLLKARGARRIKPIAVSAPFHSPLMASVAAALDAELDRLKLAKPAFPVVANVDATANTDPLRVRELLVCQVTAPVRWVDSVRALRALGITRFVELGPGRSISKLITKTDPVAETLRVEDDSTLEETALVLRQSVP